MKIPVGDGITPECLNEVIGYLNKSKEINQLVYGYDTKSEYNTIITIEEVRLRSSLFQKF